MHKDHKMIPKAGDPFHIGMKAKWERPLHEVQASPIYLARKLTQTTA